MVMVIPRVLKCAVLLRCIGPAKDLIGVWPKESERSFDPNPDPNGDGQDADCEGREVAKCVDLLRKSYSIILKKCDILF